MTPADLHCCSAFVDRLLAVTGPEVREVALLSPNYAQYRLVHHAFPRATKHFLTSGDWDIRFPCDHGFDLIVACNVLHYVDDAGTAIANLLRSGSFVWIQDLVDRDRGSGGLGGDGDCMRYSFSPHFASSFAKAFDLAAFAGHVADFHQYAADQADAGKPARHFTMVLDAGSLKRPLPDRPYRYHQQWRRLARARAAHLLRFATGPSIRARPCLASAPDRPARRRNA